MSELIVKTKSGLKIEKIGSKYVVSKGNVVEMFNSLDALTRSIAPKAEKKKKKKAVAAKPKVKKTKAAKPKVKKTKAAKPKVKKTKAAKPKVKKTKAAKPKTKKTKAAKPKTKKKTKLAGHKPGCKCVACSPATRARGMKALKASQEAPQKKVRKAPRHKGGRMSVAEAAARASEAQRIMSAGPRTFRGKVGNAGVIDVSRFKRRPAPPHPGGYKMPSRMPHGYLPARGRGY